MNNLEKLLKTDPDSRESILNFARQAKEEIRTGYMLTEEEIIRLCRVIKRADDLGISPEKNVDCPYGVILYYLNHAINNNGGDAGIAELKDGVITVRSDTDRHGDTRLTVDYVGDVESDIRAEIVSRTPVLWLDEAAKNCSENELLRKLNSVNAQSAYGTVIRAEDGHFYHVSKMPAPYVDTHVSGVVVPVMFDVAIYGPESIVTENQTIKKREPFREMLKKAGRRGMPHMEVAKEHWYDHHFEFLYGILHSDFGGERPRILDDDGFVMEIGFSEEFEWPQDNLPGMALAGRSVLVEADVVERDDITNRENVRLRMTLPFVMPFETAMRQADALNRKIVGTPQGRPLLSSFSANDMGDMSTIVCTSYITAIGGMFFTIYNYVGLYAFDKVAFALREILGSCPTPEKRKRDRRGGL